MDIFQLKKKNIKMDICQHICKIAYSWNKFKWLSSEIDVKMGNCIAKLKTDFKTVTMLSSQV